MDPASWRRFRDLTSSQFSIIQRSAKPSVAAINGACVAGGFPVALACDVRVASSSAIFKMGYRRVGLMPSMNMCFVLPYMIGLGRAKLLALTDRTISAAEAEHLGLVEAVAEPDEMLKTAIDLAQEMASGPPIWIAVTKEAMNQAYGLNLEQLRRQVDYMQFMLGRTEDHAEAIAAFVEKREPHFKGR
jgi:2-(1,2-epoxy-1,2-dihydrophenyl)acetyl-CoA isomerase